MDYFQDNTKLSAIKEKLLKVNLRIDAHRHEGSNMTTYHVVKIDPSAGVIRKILRLDVLQTLATESTTHAISTRIDTILPVEEAVWDMLKLGTATHFFGA